MRVFCFFFFGPNIVLLVASMLCVLSAPCHPERVCEQCFLGQTPAPEMLSRKLLLLLVFPLLLARTTALFFRI